MRQRQAKLALMVAPFHPTTGAKVPLTKSESKTKTHTALQAQSGSSVTLGKAVGEKQSHSSASQATSQSVNHQPGNGPGGVADKRGARPGIAQGGNGVGDVRKRNPMGNGPKSSFKSRHVPAGARRSNTGNVS
jgi:hypothetical protein